MNYPNTIPHLDPGRFAERAEESCTLPVSWYRDPEIWRLEHRAIFYRTWCYLGHLSDLPKKGDYITGEVADQNVLVIRGQDGVVRAFHNVCSHRAHPLLEGCGNRKLITCPYHQWCYGTDGKFRQARGRGGQENWFADEADLRPVRLEEYGGFLFVNMDDDAATLVEQAPKFLEDMKETCPRLPDLVCAHRFERDVAANWKTIIDNNHECYHCDVNHRSLTALIDYSGKAQWSDDGITFSHRVLRNALDNSAYALKPEEIAQKSLFGFIFPNLIPLMFPGSPSLIMFQIHSTGPETSRERMDFYLTSREPTPQEQGFIDFITGVPGPGGCRAVRERAEWPPLLGLHAGPVRRRPCPSRIQRTSCPLLSEDGPGRVASG